MKKCIIWGAVSVCAIIVAIICFLGQPERRFPKEYATMRFYKGVGSLEEVSKYESRDELDATMSNGTRKWFLNSIETEAEERTYYYKYMESEQIMLACVTYQSGRYYHIIYNTATNEDEIKAYDECVCRENKVYLVRGGREEFLFEVYDRR